MNAKKFKNFTDEDFSWKFDGILYTFKAGQEMYMEDFKSDHFAKHLVDREMNKKGIPVNMPVEREALLAQCFPGDEVVSAAEALDLNEKSKKKVAKKKVEKEFEELNDE